MIAAPFLGERGWELMRWQGHLRYLGVEKVYALKGWKYLYQDFADVVEIEVNDRKPDKWLGGVTNPVDIADIAPCKTICENKNLKQKFIKYGKKLPDNSWDVLLHARNCKRKGDKYTGDRNWRYWAALSKFLQQEGIDFAWIGSREEADVYDEGMDMRGIPLEGLANAMASSKVIIGPSSGPLHFASLCGLPHIVFSDRRKWNLGGRRGTNWTRYKKVWNPFDVRCTVLDEYDWQPPLERVLKELERYL